jgi:hypothetical protein
MPGKARTISANSRPTTLLKLDQRTKGAALIKRIRDDLCAHVGGQPSVAQRMIIDRLAVVTLRLSLFDQKLASDQPVTDHDSRVYASLHNSYRLLIRELGLRATPAPQSTLADIVADISRRKAEAAA